MPYHAHGEDIDVYIGNSIRKSVDKEGGFGGGARGAVWVPVGGDGVALLFTFSFVSLSLSWNGKYVQISPHMKIQLPK